MKLKTKKIIPFVLVTLILSLNACYDEKMEWGDPYAHPDTKDLPLELQEKISRYEALNAYTSSKLGAGIGFDLYMNDEAYRNLVNQNFDEITAGNEMKQSSVMNTQGELNFTNVDNVLERLKTAGLTVYGHTLVWHSQQQASYINSLLKPVSIPGTPGSSLIANGDFEESVAGWNSPYYAEAVTQSTDFAIDGTHSMKVAVGDWGGGKYNMQINSPEFQIINGHRYEISFFIRSDIAGSVGIDFPNGNLSNQYPWTDGKELVATNASWTKVVYNPTTVGGTGMTATADGAMTFRLLIGSTSNCTYYIDAVEVIDLDAVPEVVNMFSNGDFENGTLDPWGGWGNGTYALSAEGEGYNSQYAMILSNPKNAQAYESQAAYTFGNPLANGTSYKVTAMIKSSVNNGSIQMEVQNESYSGQYSGGIAVGTSWQEINWEFAASSADRIRFLFDYGAVAGDYYIDNIVFSEVLETPAAVSGKLRAATAGPTEIPQTMEEKAHKVDSVLKAWIKGMMTHEPFKDVVAAWEVVNEPMNENGTLREGVEDLKSTDVFHWQYYLGKDYAVKAFKYARENAPNTKLFINDFNLESANGAKLDGLIEYVQYIESQGAKVDGIGTQMHLNINWTDTNNIKSMFQKLAQTGKLIKITELDIAISSESGTGSGSPATPISPTVEQYAQQAELYRFVADAYNKYIPEAQRYGIAVWGISDNEKEHTYWLPNDAPCIWGADYARKHAYKGFADGLAGKDVSADFSGELMP